MPAAAAAPAAPADAERIDLGDATILPGLIDMHVHLTGNPLYGGYNRYRFTDGFWVAQGAGNALGAAGVGSVDGASQAVLGVVGDGDGLFLGLEGDDRQNGAEDFLLGDGHVVADIGKNSGTHEIAAVHAFGQAGSARDKVRAFVDYLAELYGATPYWDEGLAL